jgi:hypothetical protein
MEQRGAAKQLIVDGQPFLALSGELANTAPSDLDYMRHVFPILADQVHLNTVLTAMAWAWIEPREGLRGRGPRSRQSVPSPDRLALVRQLEERAIQLRARVGEGQPGALSAVPDPKRQGHGKHLDPEPEQ